MIRNMIRTMRYRLALDIGTTSLGWCLFRLTPDNAPYAIIKMGVRIFPEGRVAKTGESLAVTRRTARLHRRRRDRLLKRKAAMERALINFGFWPGEDEARHALSTLDPYALRAKGLDEVLTPAEFGRAVFHLNQRRGFKSNRKTDKDAKESSVMLNAISAAKLMYEQAGCKTIGQYLNKLHEQRLGTRARPTLNKQGGVASYDLYIDRSMIKHEFNELWQAQAKLPDNPYAALYSAAAYDKIKDVMLFQRELQKGKVGRCTFFPETEERAPLALPSVQRFRILQELNNLRIENNDGTQTLLTLAQRNVMFELLEHGSSVSFKDMAKAIQLPSTTVFNLQDAKRLGLKGNTTSVILRDKKLFGKIWDTFKRDMQDEIVTQLLAEENLSTLIDWLMQTTGVDEAHASLIANKQLPDEHSRLSSKAVFQILEKLTNSVDTYAQVIKQLGFDSQDNSEGEILNELPYYGKILQRSVGIGTGIETDTDDKRYGRIANPTVHIGLNQVRRLVNALIKEYGHPSQIVVEVTRELKQSKKHRQEITSRQSKNQDRNKRLVNDACAVLQLNPVTLSRAKRRELSQKMQLWYELGSDPIARACPYTGMQISCSMLLSSQVQIEHILPYAQTLDDSMNNKTVAMRSANQYKGNRTPFEAFGQSQDGYSYEFILENAKNFHKDKRKRFAANGMALWLGDEGGGFMARALNDTAYLSRKTKEYLQFICPGSVTTIPGRMTALIRETLELNQLLSGTEHKNRNDHRHHALDAAVIGITDTSMLQKFSHASASAVSKNMDRLLDDFELPWPKYLDSVKRGLEHITVSFKPDHSYEGAMHEAGANRLKPSTILMGQKNSKGKDLYALEKLAIENLIPIRSTSNLSRHFAGTRKQKQFTDENGNTIAYKGYVGGNNDCIEIWINENGDWVGDVIRTWDAYQTVRELGQVEGYKKLRHPTKSQRGKPLLMRLIGNDAVRMTVNGAERVMRFISVGATSGQMVFAPHNESNVAARNADKRDSFKYTTKYASSLQKTLARKVTVNELGKVLDNGFQG